MKFKFWIIFVVELLFLACCSLSVSTIEEGGELTSDLGFYFSKTLSNSQSTTPSIEENTVRNQPYNRNSFTEFKLLKTFTSKSKREISRVTKPQETQLNISPNLFQSYPTTFPKPKRSNSFAGDNEDDFDVKYEINNDFAERMGYAETDSPSLEIEQQNQFPIEESLSTVGEEKTECHISLSVGDIKWRKGNRMFIAFLPHMEPSTCNPPLKCSVSTTVHRHISLQEGDSLQIVLQRRSPSPPSPPSVTPTAFQHPNFQRPMERSKPAKESDVTLDTNTEDHIIEITEIRKEIEGNSTHLFSRENDHGKLHRKREIFGNFSTAEHEDVLIGAPRIQNPLTAGSEDKFSLTIWKVTKSEWTSCSTREGGQVAKSSTEGRANIGDEILVVGVHYFIGRSSWSSSECFKLKVLVRTADCGEGSICSGKGICFTNSSMEDYNCGCCKGYSGRHCEERDACVEEPCLNAGICLDIQEGHDGETFQCLCPYGFRGRVCESPSSLCDSNPCQNGGLCEGNHTSYSCRCSPGWTGSHCLEEVPIYATEEQRDDISSPYDDGVRREEMSGGCANGPCVHGVCVETSAQEFRCFCQPGFGGERCEMEYDECFSNPCPNGGTCVDQIGSFQCLCGPGYTGPNCLVKVNMCVPDPCPSNRVCKDKGNSFSCDCIQGLSDDDCGIHEEVCLPNPCVHGGTCYTISETLSFYCACRPGFTGQACQDASILESVGPYGTGVPVENLDLQHTALTTPLSHIKNLYTGAVTLACAFIIFLLVVSICHCRMNRPYNKCYLSFARPSFRFFPSFGILRSSSLRDKKRRDRSSAVRLDPDIDGASASMTSQSNSDSVFYNMDVCDNQELPLIK